PAGDTLALGGRRILLPQDASLETFDRGSVILSSPNVDHADFELLGQVQSFATTVIGTVGNDQITFARLPDSLTRVFTGDGDDTLNVLSTPGSGFDGTGRRQLNFVGGDGLDIANIRSVETHAAMLNLDEFNVDEAGASLRLDETAERLNVDLMSDSDHTITVEKSWAVPQTSLRTADGDDTIDVKGLMDPAQSLSIFSGGGANVVSIDQECTEGLVAIDDHFQTEEEQSIDLPVLLNDVNFDVTIGTLELENPDDEDRVTPTDVNGVPGFHYQPAPDFSGIDQFAYRITVGQNVAIGTVTVNVAGLNDAPTARDDSATTEEDRPVQISVLGNDTDPDGDTLSISGFDQPQNGSVIEIEPGVFEYTPNADFFGTDAFQYTIADPSQSIATATVTLTVNPVADTLIAVDDQAATDEDSPIEIFVLDNDINPDGVIVFPNVILPPVNGTFAATRQRSILYTPDPGFSGQDQLTYQLRDEAGNVTNAVVTINVSGVAPVANSDEFTTVQDSSLLLDVLANDEQLTNVPIQLTIDLEADFGTVSVSEINQILYTPDEGFFGTDSFRYVITDAFGNSDNAIVTLSVNALPVADAGGPYVIAEGDDLTLDGSASTDPQNGDLTYRWDIDGDGDYDENLTTATPTLPWQTLVDLGLDDGPFAGDLTLEVTNAFGVSVGTAPIVIQNVAPTIEEFQLTPSLDENGIATLLVTFADPAAVDSHEILIDWGDGSPIESVEIPVGTRQLERSHQYLDDQPGDLPDLYHVVLTVRDDDGGEDTVAGSVEVRNVEPELVEVTSSHQSVDCIADGATVTLAGQIDDVGSLDTHTLTVDWGDGSTLETIVADDREFEFSHDYASGGAFQVTVTVHDDDGGSAARTLSVAVTGVQLDDGVLRVFGTEDSDYVRVRQWGHWLFVYTRLGDDGLHLRKFQANEVESIEVVTCSGNDHIQLWQSAHIETRVDSGAGHDRIYTAGGRDFVDAGSGNDVIRTFGGDDVILAGAGNDWVSSEHGDDQVFAGSGQDIVYTGHGDDFTDGGDGNDRIHAGDGNDLVLGAAGDDWIYGNDGLDFLLGGDGHDCIHGGDGADLIVGGTGADWIDGEDGRDLLIAGFTDFDNNTDALDAIHSEWTSRKTWRRKLANLRSGEGEHLNGIRLLANETVHDDEHVDRLSGGRGRDQFFASITDRLRDRRSREVWERLE
ncbi:MAG: Ig-like domain-containing protein, partial [Planctomycetota bacterium]